MYAHLLCTYSRTELDPRPPYARNLQQSKDSCVQRLPSGISARRRLLLRVEGTSGDGSRDPIGVRGGDGWGPVKSSSAESSSGSGMSLKMSSSVGSSSLLRSELDSLDCLPRPTFAGPSLCGTGTVKEVELFAAARGAPLDTRAVFFDVVWVTRCFFPLALATVALCAPSFSWKGFRSSGPYLSP